MSTKHSIFKLTCIDSVEGSLDPGAVGHDGAREGAPAGVGLHEGVGDVGDAERDHLLRGVDGAAVGERLADGDVLQQHDQRDHQQPRAQLRHHVQEVRRAVVGAHVAEGRQLRHRHARGYRSWKWTHLRLHSDSLTATFLPKLKV